MSKKAVVKEYTNFNGNLDDMAEEDRIFKNFVDRAVNRAIKAKKRGREDLYRQSAYKLINAISATQVKLDEGQISKFLANAYRAEIAYARDGLRKISE